MIRRPQPGTAWLRGQGNPGSTLRFDLLRWVLVLCQASALILTWHLWETRDEPPLLPAFWWPLPPFPVAVPLAASLALALIAPRWGVPLHSILLVVAMAMDQTRIQPQFVSCAILLWGTLPSASMRFIAVAHLVTLWFYAGIHKLLSRPYFERGSALFSHLFPDEGRLATGGFDRLLRALSLGGALVEVALAALILVPATRRGAAAFAVVMHLGIVALLVLRQWNAAVWPWNIAVAAAAWTLFAAPEPGAARLVRESRRPARALALLLLVAPAAYYWERLDAHLAHCLYSLNKPEALIIQVEDRPGGGSVRISINESVMKATGARMPPEHRLFEAYAQRSPAVRSGDFLYIVDPRRGAIARGRARRLLKIDETRNLIPEPLP